MKLRHPMTTSDPAALLRQAAGMLQQHAEAATPGPWAHIDTGKGGMCMGCGAVVTDAPGAEGGGIAYPADTYPRGLNRPLENMAYIALMHPPVALALADLLDYLVVDCYEVPMEGIALAQAIVDSKEAS